MTMKFYTKTGIRSVYGIPAITICRNGVVLFTRELQDMIPQNVKYGLVGFDDDTLDFGIKMLSEWTAGATTLTHKCKTTVGINGA